VLRGVHLSIVCSVLPESLRQHTSRLLTSQPNYMVDPPPLVTPDILRASIRVVALMAKGTRGAQMAMVLLIGRRIVDRERGRGTRSGGGGLEANKGAAGGFFFFFFERGAPACLSLPGRRPVGGDGLGRGCRRPTGREKLECQKPARPGLRASWAHSSARPWGRSMIRRARIVSPMPSDPTGLVVQEGRRTPGKLRGAPEEERTTRPRTLAGRGDGAGRPSGNSGGAAVPHIEGVRTVGRRISPSPRFAVHQDAVDSRPAGSWTAVFPPGTGGSRVQVRVNRGEERHPMQHGPVGHGGRDDEGV